MENSGPCVTVTIERVSAENVSGMVNHDMRIASLLKPGVGYGAYPNYVQVDKIKDNLVIKETSAEEIHKEFDRRLKYRNNQVEGHNHRLKERIQQLREQGVDEEKIKTELGKFQRVKPKSALKNRAYSFLLGLSDEAFEMLGPDVPRSTVNEILTTALRTVIREIGIDEDELTHEVIHWDETKPHLHAGMPYLNKFGVRFQKDFTPIFLSKLIRKVNMELAKYGMKPPKSYKERGNHETHKSTKELKKETQRAQEVYLEHFDKATKAKNEAELAEVEAKNAHEKLIETQRKNADLNEKLAELTRTKAELKSRQSKIDERERSIARQQKELKSQETALKVGQDQLEEFKLQTGREIAKLQEEQEKLKADQLALAQQQENLNQIEKDAISYRSLKDQVAVVLSLLKKVPTILEKMMKETDLGKAITKLAGLVGFKIIDPKGPEIDP